MPALGAILRLAALQQSTPQAADLLAVYSAGLVGPFRLSAAAFGPAQSASFAVIISRSRWAWER